MTSVPNRTLVALVALMILGALLASLAPITDAQDRDDLYRLGYSDAQIEQDVAEAVLHGYAMAGELDYAYDYALSRLAPLIDASVGAGADAPEMRQTTHCWLQLKDGDAWRDLDVAAWWLPAGEAAPQHLLGEESEEDLEQKEEPCLEVNTVIPPFAAEKRSALRLTASTPKSPVKSPASPA